MHDSHGLGVPSYPSSTAPRRFRTGEVRDAWYTGPNIAPTAHAMSTDRDKCLDGGRDDYVAKPVDHKKLISTVAEYASSEELHKGNDIPVA
jgi:CheY-like chemotaxis protein